MKTLYLIRHAKSSWKYPHLDDIDRPLNKRGKRDAPNMAARLVHKHIFPDLMISSPANRALTTCKVIAGALSYSVDEIVIDHNIYHGSESTLLKAVQEVDNQHSTLFLFGHNPGFTGFANALTNSDLWNIPTCGIFGCSFETDQWGMIKMGMGTKILYDFPKNLTD